MDRVDVLYKAKLVPNADVAAQDYNLSVSSYVEQEDMREVVNITELNTEIERIVTRSDVLRREIAAIVTEIEGALIMDEQKIDYVIRNAKRSMEIEDFVIDEELEGIARSILNGEVSRKDYIEQVKLEAMRNASNEV